MATNPNAEPRRNAQRMRSMSISTAMRLAARGGLDRWLDPEILRARLADIRREQLEAQKVETMIKTLPRITEGDLEVLGEKDSHCAICLMPYLSLLAEEEMALALDTPAHPVEELGVTRLTNSCGHIFCRRDIKSWVNGKHKTCPTCRQPFFVISDEELNMASASETTTTTSASILAQIIRDQAQAFTQREEADPGFIASLGDVRDMGPQPTFVMPRNDEEEHDRPVGMYS